jgi:hypothetical protein
MGGSRAAAFLASASFRCQPGCLPLIGGVLSGVLEEVDAVGKPRSTLADMQRGER